MSATRVRFRDPLAGRTYPTVTAPALTAEQRAAIRPGDRLIVVCMPVGADPDPKDNAPPHGCHLNGLDGPGDRTLARSGALAGA